MCIRVLGGSFKQSANIMIIIAVVKQATPNMPQKSDKVRAVVVRTAKGVQQTVLISDLMIMLLLLLKTIIHVEHVSLVLSHVNYVR
jgi:hypothetical protein